MQQELSNPVEVKVSQLMSVCLYQVHISQVHDAYLPSYIVVIDPGLLLSKHQF